MGNVENLVLMLVMFKYLFNVQEKEGCKVNLEYFELLQKLLDILVVEFGQIVDEYLDKLVFEFEIVEVEEGEEVVEVVGGDVVEVVVDVEVILVVDSDSKLQV